MKEKKTGLNHHVVDDGRWFLFSSFKNSSHIHSATDDETNFKKIVKKILFLPDFFF